MSQWKAVYQNKRRAREDEIFACTGCGSQYEPENRAEGCHSEGPPNDLCICGDVHINIISNAFRQGYELIRWER